METINLETVPSTEKSINNLMFSKASQKEASVFELFSFVEAKTMTAYLTRIFGKPPQGSFLEIFKTSHKLALPSGENLKVLSANIRFIFNPDIMEQFEYAEKLEDEFPNCWDDKAKKDLEEIGYFKVME